MFEYYPELHPAPLTRKQRRKLARLENKRKIKEAKKRLTFVEKATLAVFLAFLVFAVSAVLLQFY